MSKTHFFSQKNEDDYTFHPGRLFGLDWSDIEGDCKIFFLSERAAAMLRKLVQVFPKYYWVWGIEGPQRDWTQAQWDEWEAIQDFVSETEAALVSGCDAQGMFDALNRLTAVLAGEASTETDEQGNPLYDYTDSGVVPTLNQLFTTNEELFYDSRNMAEILSIGLIGRKLDLLPLPWQGTGLADIADEQMQTLHERFVMADNVIGEKNMAETMESLLRKTGLLDPEAQPNVSDILDNVLRLGGNESWWGMVKRLFRDALIKLGLEDSLEDIENITITQAIMLLSASEQDGGVLRAIERAIRESQTEININNTANCNGGKPSLNGSNNGQIVLTDEGVNVEIEQPETPPLLGDGN